MEMHRNGTLSFAALAGVAPGARPEGLAHLRSRLLMLGLVGAATLLVALLDRGQGFEQRVMCASFSLLAALVIIWFRHRCRALGETAEVVAPLRTEFGAKTAVRSAARPGPKSTSGAGSRQRR